MHVVSILNLKGGVGKTTTAVNLAAAGFYSGRRTLLVDLDPQNSTTDHLSNADFETTAGAMLKGECTFEAACHQLFASEDERACLDLLPSGKLELTEADVMLQSRAAKNRLKSLLRKAVRAMAAPYDLAVIDTGPGLDFLWFNALYTADMVVCPVELQMAAIVGLRRFLEVLDFANEDEGLDAPVYYLPTNNDGRVKESGELLEVLHEQFGVFPEGKVLPPIRYSAALSKALGARQSIFAFDPTDRSAADYAALLHTLMQEVVTHG